MDPIAARLHLLTVLAHNHGNAQLSQGYLQSHIPNNVGAVIALTFIAGLIVLCFRAGSRRGGRD